MPETPKHSVSVAGVVLDEAERVLLIQRRDNGRWEPPGGVLELGEGFTEGVCREVHEETGLIIDVEQLTGVYKNMIRGVVVLVFRCRAVDGTIRPTDEAARVEWFGLSEALPLMDEAYAVRVTDAYQDTPATREHDGVRLTAYT
ncbi:ADP-ribose pyrophosphatase YjhB (NUDIX family) [Halopolyspora algeriensis]|uniref:ADP-ribose pyrophosphatase YjhB (NUDIX family) n=1 Tax=Halopolyspora algeriensis TaxID=1500506 RepID=A0A368W068_9ACTN|nr:NUDIX domain-containing protein [Halopolyspora algeriensis]RCW47022.1 ADP-ribose pyrophosphatase YjhB (NUDIX family) [Halopolyspora algeriensis]TQM48109.1 ADP-ribose pyrophosphatase YjhB (NUDIX family) [Halopolyspora algeriensis]